MTHELEIEARIGREDRGCNGTEGVVADPEYGTLVEYSDTFVDANANTDINIII